MTEEEYINVLHSTRNIVELIRIIPNIKDAIDMANKCQSVSPFLDPSLFREKSGDLRFDIRLMKIINKAKEDIDKIFSEYENKK